MGETTEEEYEIEVLLQEKMGESGGLWDESFSHRPSWCDAKMALKQVKKKKAKGNVVGLYVRSGLQWVLFKHGCFIQRFALEITLLMLLVFCVTCVGLGNAKILVDIVKLWVPKGGRLEKEGKFMGEAQRAVARDLFISKQLEKELGNSSEDSSEKVTRMTNQTDSKKKKKKQDLPDANFGSDSGLGGGFQVTIQTPRQYGLNILTQEDLLLHAKMLVDIAEMRVHLFNESWGMSDICFKPPAPKVNAGAFTKVANLMLDQIIPCMLITPLDCFWDGAKPLGPYPPLKLPDEAKLFIPSLPAGNVTWKNLNPTAAINDVEKLISLGMIKTLFDRAGIGGAYQERPCIDPLDPECPDAAPNALDFCAIVDEFVEWNNQQSTPYTLTQSEKSKKRRKRQSDDDDFDYDYGDGGTGEYDDGFSGFGDSFSAFFGLSSAASDKLKSKDCRMYGESVRDLLRTEKGLIERSLPENLWPQIPDFGQMITGGCPGFASAILNWPEDMIIGGIKRKDNNVVKAEALQTVMMLAGGGDVYARYKDGHSTKPNLDTSVWRPWMPGKIMDEWQRKFTRMIYDYPNNTDGDGPRQVHPLAGTSLQDMLEEFSKFRPYTILIGYVLMLFYAGFSLFKAQDGGVASCAGVAVGGVLLVTLASVVGLSASVLLGVHFNAATTQIVPFLTLGLGVDDMFLLVHSYQEVVGIVNKHELGHLLKETGLSVLLTSICNILAFFCGSLVPVPAMKAFCLQVAIVLVVNVIAILTVYPAMLGIDLFRRKSRRVDILCCKKVGGDKLRPMENKPVPIEKKKDSSCRMYELQQFVTDYYGPFITNKITKIVVVVCFILLFGASCYGTSTMVQGLELTDVIPKGTASYSFLDARERYFSFYPMFAVIKGPVDFANKQKLIREYRDALGNSEYAVSSGGKLGEYWLNLMTDWLIAMQNEYDKDYAKGFINKTHVLSDASAEGRLAYKMFCNVGDKVNCSRNDGTTRLVDKHRNINIEGFYNYLTAWYYQDNMMYYVSQATFIPRPPFWSNGPSPKIPPATPPHFSQIPFFLNGLVDTPHAVDMIRKVRAICDEFDSRGLPNFPQGIPFTFFEQYLYLTQNLVVNLAIIIGCVFLVITLLLVSPWVGLIITTILLMMVVELIGFMALAGLKLNPISVVPIITAVGIGVEFTVHICLSFLTTLGTRDERVIRTLEHMFVPVTQGGVSTLLGIAMLAFSQFQFIVRYFFMVLALLVLLGLLNGLILLPVLLSLIGPPCEVQTIDGSNALAPPTPEASRKKPPPDEAHKHPPPYNGHEMTDRTANGRDHQA